MNQGHKISTNMFHDTIHQLSNLTNARQDVLQEHLDPRSL